jgi:hypothetical protein
MNMNKKKLTHADIDRMVSEMQSDEAYDTWLSNVDALLGNLSESEQTTSYYDDMTDADIKVHIIQVDDTTDIDELVNNIMDTAGYPDSAPDDVENDRTDFIDKIKYVIKAARISGMTGGISTN